MKVNQQNHQTISSSKSYKKSYKKLRMEDEQKPKNPKDQTISSPHLSLVSSPGTPHSSNSTSQPSSPPLTTQNPIQRTNKDFVEPVTTTSLHERAKRVSKKSNLGSNGSSLSRMMNWVAFGFRVFGAICCLISFSVMTANRNKGWALDSFYNYKEFSYILAVNVIGFTYSAVQVFASVYYFATGKHVLKDSYRYFFDFVLDQIVTYLLISASSSATTRIDDWQLNWGSDKFPDMATGSVAISFLAFVSLAFSTLISGYTLCTSKLLQF